MTSNYINIKLTKITTTTKKHRTAIAVDNKGNTYIITSIGIDTRYTVGQYWQVDTKDICRCKADKKQDFWINSYYINQKLIIKNGKLVFDTNFHKTYTDLNFAKSPSFTVATEYEQNLI